MTEFKILKSQQEYKEAYERLYTLAFGKEVFTENETNEIELLKHLIDVYQNEHIKLPNPKPLEANEFKTKGRCSFIWW
jgi:hypothetical protein